jgi:Putative ER transporter, 6TM, N-terminal
MWTIQTTTGFTLGYLLPDSVPLYYLPKTLLIEMLLALALSTGVNLVVFPISSRQIFFVTSLILTFYFSI